MCRTRSWLDWTFYRIAFARYRQQRQERLRRILIALAVVAVLVLAWMYGRSISARWASIPEFALVGGVDGGVTAYVLAKILAPIASSGLLVTVIRSPSLSTTTASTQRHPTSKLTTRGLPLLALRVFTAEIGPTLLL